MKKIFSLLLSALLVSLCAAADTGVTEETVQALLKDMGDPGEAKLPIETQHALAYVSGSSSAGPAFFIRPEGMECSSDGRLIRLKLKERPCGDMKTANFRAGETASLIELDYGKEKFTM